MRQDQSVLKCVVTETKNAQLSTAVVTREIKIFQNYFTGLLQLTNIFQHAHCRQNNFEIILELLQRLK